MPAMAQVSMPSRGDIAVHSRPRPLDRTPIGIDRPQEHMTLFDPRRRATRFTPVMLMTAAAAMSAAFATGRVPATPTAADPPTLTSAQVAVLETRAFAAAAAPMGLTVPRAVPVELRRGETFEQAVQRTGVGAAEA